ILISSSLPTRRSSDLEKVSRLSNLTSEFNELPKSERAKDEMFELLREYNAGIAKLKQYDPQETKDEDIGFDYDNPDALIEQLGIDRKSIRLNSSHVSI